MQSLNQEYLALHQFLGTYASLWQHEPLACYPTNAQLYPTDWIDEFSDHRKLFQLYAKTLGPSSISSPSLARLLHETSELERIAPYTFLQSDHPASFSHDYLTLKKTHELTHFIPFLSDCAQNQHSQTIVDVGSGHGHLGRTLASLINLPIICLERNEDLIMQGKTVASKQRKENALTFVEQDLRPELLKFSPYSPFIALNLKGPVLLVGLHTCGNLALSQILLGLNSAALQINPIINIPCCYFHLHPHLETNLSLFSQLYPLAWTPQALTLATRAHWRQDKNEYREMARVKEFRYTLQLFFQEEMGISQFFPVGSSHKRFYRKSFAEYAISKLEAMGLPLPSPERLQTFQMRPSTQKKVHDLFTMTLLRWRFGRMLEKALLIDRALWLEQHGYEVKLFTLFDESISPRNIVFYATKL